VGFKQAEREGWWSKPGFTLYELNINSLIACPAQGEEIQLQNKLADTYTLKGVAYTGGGREITRVEVSLDEGKNWDKCEFEFPKYSLRNGVKRWTWCIWNFRVPIWKLFKAAEIIVRAWDSSSNTQPKDITWNLLGMMNNSWYTVKVKCIVSRRLHLNIPPLLG
jgi:nitrate reductase (NAD(P)H)